MNIQPFITHDNMLTLAITKSSLDQYLYFSDTDFKGVDQNLIKMILSYMTFDSKNHTLEKCVESGNLPVLKYLIDQRENINAFTLMIIASEHGHLEMIKYLEQVTDINKYDYAIFISYASEHGHFEIVKYFIEQEFKNDDNESMIYNRALIEASGHGHLEIVKYLLEHGSLLYVDHFAPFTEAVRGGHFELVKYLTTQGIWLDLVRNYALVDASERGYLDIVKYLVKGGFADISKYAIEKASINNHNKIVEYFATQGPPVDDDTFYRGKLAYEFSG